MFGFNDYNYETFRRKDLTRTLVSTKFMGAPKPGERAPDFEARTIEGEKIRLSDYRGTNVVLTFGSATCPLTAASIGGLNDLYADYSKDGIEFLFVYVREAHPGEDLPAHHTSADKVRAAELFRAAEKVEMPILLDDLGGRIHRKYGKAPNPTYLIDRSGRIAFRALNTDPKVIAEALDELLEVQEERDTDHAIVRGGDYSGIPAARTMLHAHRALKRGGRRAIQDFQHEMGMPGRLAVIGGRVVDPIVDHPGAFIATMSAVAGVIALGVWGGMELRKRRLGTYRNPYEYGRFRSRRSSDTGDYEAVGI